MVPREVWGNNNVGIVMALRDYMCGMIVMEKERYIYRRYISTVVHFWENYEEFV